MYKHTGLTPFLVFKNETTPYTLLYNLLLLTTISWTLLWVRIIHLQYLQNTLLNRCNLIYSTIFTDEYYIISVFVPWYIMLFYISYIYLYFWFYITYSLQWECCQKICVFKIFITARIEKVETIHIPTSSIWECSPILNTNNLLRFYFVIWRLKSILLLH